ncbi:uncharacterized protein LOC111637713 [Centruroides sculpturatus]|uniref:uncharacterized protein LOC111637713 n=1 Tax=Centruroides sculpturatus TaxID=218467 RepID=UPI000C6DF1CF|nr:uncharacterized protein LOC111637713 [Centruroides sculpturatus]
MSKQLSGAQKRNIRKRKLEECKPMSQQFVKWLSTETLENRGSAEEVKPNTASQADDSTLHLTSTPSMNDNSQRSKNKEPLQEVKSITSQDILLQLPHNNSKEDEPAQIGYKTRNEILRRIKKAKYYTIVFDCTPDVSRKEQMSQMIRYVHVDCNGKLMIEESFINFIQSHEKKGEGLSTEILNKLEVDKLDIQDFRGQGFDNGANMAGKYKGVSARILEINNLAIFVPCAAHNLNLAGVHAAPTTPEMITFFGIVHRLFNFFSSSTTRWDILMKCLKLSLKSFSDTRWSSKASAIKALYLQLPEVMKGLQTISNDFSNPEVVSNAKSLILQINYKFICTLSIWNKILQCIDRTNKALQQKDLSIDCETKLIAGLLGTLQGLRDTGFNQNLQEVQKLAEEMEISFINQFLNIRIHFLMFRVHPDLLLI